MHRPAPAGVRRGGDASPPWRQLGLLGDFTREAPRPVGPALLGSRPAPCRDGYKGRMGLACTRRDRRGGAAPLAPARPSRGPRPGGPLGPLGPPTPASSHTLSGGLQGTQGTGPHPQGPQTRHASRTLSGGLQGTPALALAGIAEGAQLGHARLRSVALGCARSRSVALGCARLRSAAPESCSVARGCARLRSVARGLRLVPLLRSPWA